MKLLAYLLFLGLYRVYSEDDVPDERSAADMIGSALNGYVAVLNRMARIYDIVTHQQQVTIHSPCCLSTNTDTFA